MSTTRVTRWVDASPDRVYAALLDATLIPRWRVPNGMSCLVHEFEPLEGGRFRVSLTYDAPTQGGKTSAQTDTYHGFFEELIPGERIVERIEFETEDPSLRGEMRITTTLAAEGVGTMLIGEHEGLPPGVRPEDNVLGWEQSLAKLAGLLERYDESSRR